VVEGLPGTLGYFNCLSLFGVTSFLCDPTCYFVVGIGYGPIASMCLSVYPGSGVDFVVCYSGFDIVGVIV
jgi:hypothetical protein